GLSERGVRCSQSCHAVLAACPKNLGTRLVGDGRWDDEHLFGQAVHPHVPTEDSACGGGRLGCDDRAGTGGPACELENVNTHIGPDVEDHISGAHSAPKEARDRGLVVLSEQVPISGVDAVRLAIYHPRHTSVSSKEVERGFVEWTCCPHCPRIPSEPR